MIETKHFKRALIISSTILLLFGIVLMILRLGFSEKKQTFEEFEIQYQEETILPKNMLELYNYKGERNFSEVYRSLKIFSEYISYLNKNILTDSDLEKFFEVNKVEIKDKLGIVDYELFRKFIENLKDKKVDINDFEYAEIESGSSVLQSKYYSFNVIMHYKENSIKIKIKFANKNNIKRKIIYSICED